MPNRVAKKHPKLLGPSQSLRDPQTTGKSRYSSSGVHQDTGLPIFRKAKLNLIDSSKDKFIQTSSDSATNFFLDSFQPASYRASDAPKLKKSQPQPPSAASPLGSLGSQHCDASAFRGCFGDKHEPTKSNKIKHASKPRRFFKQNASNIQFVHCV